MSQFIRAIEIDQTPNRLMAQMGSELAEQANRKAQLDASMNKLRADQDKNLNDLYQGFQKAGFEQIKGMKGEVVNSMLSKFQQNLASALKESKGDPMVFTQMGYDKALKELASDKANSDQILAIGEERAKALEAAGFRPEAIRGKAAEYAMQIGSGKNAEAFIKDLENDMNERPQLYMDPTKVFDVLKGRKIEKGQEIERKATLDPTGSIKNSAAIKSERKPWEQLGVYKATNGIEVEVPMVKFDKVKDYKGDLVDVVDENTYQSFIGESPAVASALRLIAKDTVHDVNKRIGINTATMTREQFAQAQKSNPNLIDPFNEGILDTYAKNAVTKQIRSDYNSDGFKVPQGLETSSVKDNPVRNSTTVINKVGGNEDSPYINAKQLTLDKINDDKKRFGKNYTHTQVNSLPGAAKEVVLKLAKLDLPGPISDGIGSESVLVKDVKGKPAIFSSVDIKDENGEVLRKKGQFLAYMDDAANIIANGKLNVKSRVAAAAPISTKSKTTNPKDRLNLGL